MEISWTELGEVGGGEATRKCGSCRLAVADINESFGEASAHSSSEEQICADVRATGTIEDQTAGADADERGGICRCDVAVRAEGVDVDIASACDVGGGDVADAGGGGGGQGANRRACVEAESIGSSVGHKVCILRGTRSADHGVGRDHAVHRGGSTRGGDEALIDTQIGNGRWNKRQGALRRSKGTWNSLTLVEAGGEGGNRGSGAFDESQSAATTD